MARRLVWSCAVSIATLLLRGLQISCRSAAATLAAPARLRPTWRDCETTQRATIFLWGQIKYDQRQNAGRHPFLRPTATMSQFIAFLRSSPATQPAWLLSRHRQTEVSKRDQHTMSINSQPVCLNRFACRNYPKHNRFVRASIVRRNTQTNIMLILPMR